MKVMDSVEKENTYLARNDYEIEIRGCEQFLADVSAQISCACYGDDLTYGRHGVVRAVDRTEEIRRQHILHCDLRSSSI